MARGRPTTPPGQYGNISVSRTSNGTYQASTRLRLYDGNSVRLRATARTKTAAMHTLKARCEERLGTTDSGQVTGTTKLKALLETWIEQHDVSEKSKTSYRNNIDGHIVPSIGELRLNELAPHNIQAYISSRSASVARTSRAVLSSALGFAVRTGALSRSPWQEIKLPKGESKEIVRLTSEQITAFKAAVKAWSGGNTSGPPRGHGLLQIVEVAEGSGMRASEVLGLRIEDVDTTNRRVRVYGQSDGKGGRTEVLKNRSSQFSRRVISVTPTANAAIQTMLNDEFVQAVGGPLFPSSTGGYRNVNSVGNQLRQASEGLEWEISLKDFRSTMASVLTEKYGLEAAQRQLGHSSSNMTDRYYAAPPPVIEDYLGGE